MWVRPTNNNSKGKSDDLKAVEDMACLLCLLLEDVEGKRRPSLAGLVCTGLFVGTSARTQSSQYV